MSRSFGMVQYVVELMVVAAAGMALPSLLHHCCGQAVRSRSLCDPRRQYRHWVPWTTQMSRTSLFQRFHVAPAAAKDATSGLARTCASPELSLPRQSLQFLPGRLDQQTWSAATSAGFFAAASWASSPQQPQTQQRGARSACASPPQRCPARSGGSGTRRGAARPPRAAPRAPRPETPRPPGDHRPPAARPRPPCRQLGTRPAESAAPCPPRSTGPPASSTSWPPPACSPPRPGAAPPGGRPAPASR
mmetsp:Transcript_114707/g.335406  ORF Transcript_114707/g.335406 Transcript_114707/m.335406 type:complete len:247 (+) Transcript_114707:892-1632(+)